MIRDFSQYLTPWEKIKIEVLTAARAHLPRRDEAAKLFTARLSTIKNRACQRARFADGAIKARGPNSRRAVLAAALITSGDPAAQHSEAKK